MLYCTCRHFWNIKTNEYLFFSRVSNNTIDIVYVEQKVEIAFMAYSRIYDGKWRLFGARSIGDRHWYYRKRKASIDAQLTEYSKRFKNIPE